ncbi:MAG: winged helix-turn-helix domain-containing protein [Methanolobus sp.]
MAFVAIGWLAREDKLYMSKMETPGHLN